MARDGETSSEVPSDAWSRQFDSVSRSLRGTGPAAHSFDTILALMQESRLPTLLAWGSDLRVWPTLRDSKLADLFRQVRAWGRPGTIEYWRRRDGVQPTWI